MKYALGNMLNGAGGLNADQLALDLQFAADKTLTARRGPTPVLTRGSTGTFVGSNGLIQSAAINAARFDHDPVSPFACRGLLIEEQRTNLVFPSDALTTQTRTVTAVTHTLSFYGTGTVVLSGAHSATVVGTGAYPSRQTLTFTPMPGSLILTVTGTVQFAQLEAGSFATSYIPTTTSTLARSADVCSITGGDFTNLWNASEGTMFINSTRLVTGTSFNPILSANDGTNNNRVAIGNSGGSSVREFLVVRLGTGEYSRSPSISADNRRMALAYSQTSTNSSDNASLGTDDTSSLIPSVTQLVIGAGQVIPAIRYYKKRLPNAKLQALTA